jgi:hypothetical protein
MKSDPLTTQRSLRLSGEQYDSLKEWADKNYHSNVSALLRRILKEYLERTQRNKRN